ncbi:MAG: TIGR02444 family protein [Gammaproteobacteria bacterium]
MDTPHWTFTVSLYGDPGVAAECLSLQERFGVNINLLLFCTYLGSEYGVSLSREDIACAESAIAGWQMHVVNALRGVRRFLKPPSEGRECSHDASAESLRAQVKSAELEAERMEAEMLTDWYLAHRSEWRRDDRNTTLAGNCATVLAHYGAAQADLPQRLIAAALARTASTILAAKTV